MRLPKERQLSPEQRRICYAEPSGTTMVVGPPGSGKTVVALFRHRSMLAQDETSELVMFNHVLTSFTEQEKTFLTWLSGWWKRATGQRFPKVTIESDDRRYGRVVYDYTSAGKTLLQNIERVKANGHWGHLILDEAQDFHSSAHALLWLVQNHAFEHMEEDERPSLMILADENQRITERSATLREICDAHQLSSDSVHFLKSNYRNTREIAEFSSHFYTGGPSGRPELPTVRGEKPFVQLTRGKFDGATDRIARYARVHENHQIGVLVPYTTHLRQFQKRLEAKLSRSGIKVQAYTSKGGRELARTLDFANPRTITILCYASAKGMEFDAVFLPELQEQGARFEENDLNRMNLYVMCSRARSYLWLGITDYNGRNPIWDCLPPEHLYTLER